MRREAPPGGEPLLNVTKDQAIFLPQRGTPKWVLNRRLPRIAARDLLSIVRFGNYSSAQRADRPNTRRDVLGSRLLNKVCGQARRRDKYRGVFSVRPNAAPPPGAARSPTRRIAHSLTRRHAIDITTTPH
jgi:hypothetical protein